MLRQFVGRISFPHPLGESPGSYLLFESTLPIEKQDMLRELKEHEFGGLEYRCTNVKCRKPVGLSEFSCNKCAEPLEIKVDVVEQAGIKKIVPATARAWCPNGHKFTYGKKFHGKCIEDKADLEYCLIGNERTEFALWMCMAISSREAGTTTPYYEAVLSTRSIGRALDVLVATRSLERKTLDVVLGNYAKEPEYFIMTEKGLKERDEYMQKIKSYGLLNDFRTFISVRKTMLLSVEEPVQERNKRFLSVLDGILVENIPDSVRKSLLLDYLPASRFKAELRALAKAGAPAEIKTWLQNWYVNNARITPGLSEKQERQSENLVKQLMSNKLSVDAYAQARNEQADDYASIVQYVPAEEIPVEVRQKILDVRDIKFKGIKELLKKHIDAGTLYDGELYWLEGSWRNQIPGVQVAKSGVVYEFSVIPRRRTGQPFVVTHVPTLYQKEIFAQDNKLVWDGHARF